MPPSRMTNSGFAVSFASPVNNSKDLMLYDIESLKKFNLKNHYATVVCDEYLLQNNVPERQNFFYLIECWDKKKFLYGERGVGEIYKRYRKNYLKREYSLYFNDNTGWDKTNGELFDFPNNYEIICKPTIPEKYIDIFVYPYSVMCSIKAGVPTPVELEEATLLGRLDNQIQSIDSNELRLILGDNNIVDALESTNKPLSLQSKVVDLVSSDSRVAADIITAHPRHNKPTRAQRGSIVFNSETNCFEGFDGTKWRTLKWEDS